MCLPVATIIGITGTALSAAGMVQQGVQASAQSRYHAALRQQTALQAQERSDENARRVRERARRLLGRQRANLGTAGLARTGSPGDVLMDVADSYEDEARLIERQGASAASAERLRAAAALASGRSSARMRGLGVANLLLGTVPDYISDLSTFNR
ncbi:MAG: hypothetical protein U9N14_05820 [Pseudomonadota bacterium]|nr:hypothetical protein [Pseudomonadota bacterium]